DARHGLERRRTDAGSARRRPRPFGARARNSRRAAARGGGRAPPAGDPEISCGRGRGVKISAISARREDFGLTRPYTIAFDTTDSVENFIVRIATDGGAVGFGAASPAPHVTGESLDGCGRALSPEKLSWLIGAD